MWDVCTHFYFAIKVVLTVIGFFVCGRKCKLRVPAISCGEAPRKDLNQTRTKQTETQERELGTDRKWSRFCCDLCSWLEVVSLSLSSHLHSSSGCDKTGRSKLEWPCALRCVRWTSRPTCRTSDAQGIGFEGVSTCFIQVTGGCFFAQKIHPISEKSNKNDCLQQPQSSSSEPLELRGHVCGQRSTLRLQRTTLEPTRSLMFTKWNSLLFSRGFLFHSCMWQTERRS